MRLTFYFYKKHGVVYFTLTKRTFTPDRGYDYDKVISFH